MSLSEIKEQSGLNDPFLEALVPTSACTRSRPRLGIFSNKPYPHAMRTTSFEAIPFG